MGWANSWSKVQFSYYYYYYYYYYVTVRQVL